MNNKTLPRNITRADYTTYHGYVLTITCAGARYHRYFPDHWYGGKEESYKAAVEKKEHVYAVMNAEANFAEASLREKKLAKKKVLLKYFEADRADRKECAAKAREKKRQQRQQQKLEAANNPDTK